MDSAIADHLARTELTTLALYSVTHASDGSIDEGQPGFRAISGAVGRTLRDDAQARGARVELVYTSFGERKNRHLFDRPELVDTVVDSLVELASTEGFDGINVDVEGLPTENLTAYGGFVGRLREAFRAAVPEGQVSVATQANVRGSWMALAATSNGADRVFVMGYDYRVAGSEPGASAPLDRLDDERDLAWSLDQYETVGVPLDRTILGLPLYGMRWPVAGPELGAPRTGRGEVWIPRRNLALLGDPTLVETHDPVESVELLARPSPDGGGWEAVYVDSPSTLARKLALADERGLAGGGFWALGYERGQPTFTDLIAAFAAGDVERFLPAR
jgi:spore germination protein YaaH